MGTGRVYVGWDSARLVSPSLLPRVLLREGREVGRYDSRGPAWCGAGIKDVLAKSLGSSNHANVVKATIEALRGLRRKDEIFKTRGIRPAMTTTAEGKADGQ